MREDKLLEVALFVSLVLAMALGWSGVGFENVPLMLLGAVAALIGLVISVRFYRAWRRGDASRSR